MGSSRFGACVWAVVAVFLFLFLTACGGSKPPGPSPFPVKITLNPSTSASLQVGTALVLSASAVNVSGGTLSPAFTFVSSNPGILDIAPNGFACAGTWNAPLYTICTPAGIGTVQVTASALGATSPPTIFYIHPPIDNITISVAAPVNSPPPACPSQTALPATCNLKFNTEASKHCLSQNQVQTLQATAFSQGVDITASVGPFTWTEANASVVRVVPLVNPDINVATYQATASPSAPGQTQVIASASGVFSQPHNFETCPVQCIALEVGTQGSGETSFSVTKGTSQTITATAVDVQGCIVPKAPLTWVSSAPAAITAACAADSNTCAVTTAQPGAAAITASCTPPACNIGFPLNPGALPAPFVPQPVYPITAISGLSTGAAVATTVLASSQDCSGTASCNVGIYNVSSSSGLSGGAGQMPASPNSLMFDAAGDRAFAGSQFGAFAITPANFGGTASPFTSLPAQGTTLGLVTGKVLAVSSNGGTAIFSDTVSTPNRVYLVASSSSTISLNINSAIAAAFSPDGLKAFILGNGGNTLYVYSTLQSLQTYPLAAPATSIVFNSTGSFALLAGGSSPSTLAIRNTCDNSAVNLSITPGLPGPPLFLKMVPAGNVPMGNPIIPMPLMTDGLDFFFGLDNTGIDIIATNSSLLPLPLPAGPLTVPTLCPRPIVLAQSPTNPSITFEPLHINIGFGTFHPINFFLSPDSTQAYIVTSDFGVLIYSFNTGSVSRIPLVNDAAPVAADMAADGSLIFVAGSDGLLHELNTATAFDQNQTLFSPLPNSPNNFCFTGTNCALNLVAVKP